MLDNRVMAKREDNTEQAILSAAEKEFLDKGFALAKTVEIAKKAGVTHAMLHYYFRTKENLFERIFQEKVEMLSRSLSMSFDDGKPFMSQVEDLVGAHYDFIAENPRLPLFVLNEIQLSEERRKVYLPMLLSGLRDTLRQLDEQLGRALRKGEVRPVRTVDLLFSIASLNIMTFIGMPVAEHAFGLGKEGILRFVRQRRAENIETILSRIRI